MPADLDWSARIGMAWLDAGGVAAASWARRDDRGPVTWAAINRAGARQRLGRARGPLALRGPAHP